MEIDDKLKEELHLHTLAMEEQQKTRARLLDQSDYFNRILEMNTEVERRKIAAQAMCVMLARPLDYLSISECAEPEKGIAKKSVVYADALITELNKKKDGK